MKLLHVVGARPQFIKLAPLCRAIREHNDSALKDTTIESIIIHTGQHYDYLMSKVFFDDLQIPEPDYNLEVGSGRHGQQTGLMLCRIEEVILKENPDMVIVYGDTNSTLAGALAASKLHIPIAHVEAGLRSYNQQMPEEINRVLTDHISAILLCPTKIAVDNLKKEGFSHIAKEGELVNLSDFPHGIPRDVRGLPEVINVGDIMYDSLLFSLQRALEKPDFLKVLGLESSSGEIIPYALCTVHRQENTDTNQRLKTILCTLDKIAGDGMRVIFPVHPRTRKFLEPLEGCFAHITLMEPVSYYDMLLLEKNARVILTDSGGVQKEAFLMKVPCITLRDETEWVETVEAGMNVVSGVDQDKILFAYNHTMQEMDDYKNRSAIKPFGNGDSAHLILETIGCFMGK